MTDIFLGEERRADYADFVTAKIKVESMQQEIITLNSRIEHLEKVADKFEILQHDIKWIRYIAQGIGAIVVFLFGDVIKKKLGL